MMEEEPQTIRSLFLTAERLENNISSSYDSSSPSYQDDLIKAITAYESCLKLADQVSLFSPNESLDDVSSSDIQQV
jgi:immunoglobulin-binding protein 1